MATTGRIPGGSVLATVDMTIPPASSTIASRGDFPRVAVNVAIRND
jgi:hypothetical protein